MAKHFHGGLDYRNQRRGKIMCLESARKEDVQVGDKMPDGTIYVGISPDTGNAMYTTPADAPLTYTLINSRPDRSSRFSPTRRPDTICPKAS
jgi:hypothetical protein